MRRSSVLGAVLCLAAPACQPAAASEARWVDPGWRQTVSREVRVEPDGGYLSVLSATITARDESGARAIAQQQFGYGAEDQALEIREAVTVKADGRVIPVDPRAVADQPAAINPAAPIFSSRRNRLVAFPDLGAGDAIRYVVETRSLKPRFPGVFSWSEYYPEALPPGEITLTFDVPDAVELRVDAVGVETERETRGGRALHRFTRRHDAPQPATPGLSPRQGAPRVHVSTARDYPEMTAGFAKRNAEAAASGPAIAAKAREIVGPASDPEEKARRLSNWVAANIRYVMMAFGEGGYVSEPADRVLAMRYGDCKAHSVLLKALLAEVGIASEPVLVTAATPLFELPKVPVLTFDHMILYLPGLDRYIDPTSPTAGFAALPAGLSGKPVYHLDSERLARIPVAGPDDHAYLVETDLRLDRDGVRSGTTRATGSRRGEAFLRGRLSGMERTDRRTFVAEQLKRESFEGQGEIDWTAWRDLDRPLAITSRIKLKPIPLDKPARLRLVPHVDPRPRAFQAVMGAAPTGPWSKGFACAAVSLRETVRLSLPAGIAAAPLSRPLARSFDLSGELDGPVQGRIEVDSRIVEEGDAVVATRRFVASFDGPVCPAGFATTIAAAAAAFEETRKEGVLLRAKAPAVGEAAAGQDPGVP